MPNPFDKMAHRVYKTTTRLMGYTATWTPSNDPTVTHTARVHFKKPNEKDERFNTIEFDPREYYMEYFITDFVGLQDVAHIRAERIIIEGIEYIPEHVKGIWDGQTYLVRLHLPDEL